MGNHESGVDSAIILDKQIYQAGETVNGRLYINARKSFPCMLIELEIEGVQSCTFTTEDNQSHTAHEKLFKVNEILESFSFNYDLRGQFVYPFSFVLMSQIPGSYYEDSQYHARITYRIKAIIRSNLKDINPLEKDIEFIVRQGIREKTSRALYSQRKIQCMSCFCLVKGSTRVDCYLEKNFYEPEDECPVKCQIDNANCLLDLARIKCQLVKETTLTSTNGVSRTFTEPLHSIMFDGVPSGQRKEGFNKQTKQIKLISPHSLMGLHPITDGERVKCRYYFEIKPEFAGFLVKAEVEGFTLKVNILQKALHQEQLVPPKDWEPRYQQCTSIILNYTKKSILQSQELFNKKSQKQQIKLLNQEDINLSSEYSSQKQKSEYK